MGMRSQIYISFKKGPKRILIARYHSWNFAERMISRAAGIIGLIQQHLGSPFMFNDELEQILKEACDVNFDYRDILLSKDMTQFEFSEGDYNLFTEEVNNNGKFFVWVDDDCKTIRYCFSDTTASALMSAQQYFDWDTKDYEELKREALNEKANVIDNMLYIQGNATVMTLDELHTFIEGDYGCVVNGIAKDTGSTETQAGGGHDF